METEKPETVIAVIGPGYYLFQARRKVLHPFVQPGVVIFCVTYN